MYVHTMSNKNYLDEKKLSLQGEETEMMTV